MKRSVAIGSVLLLLVILGAFLLGDGDKRRRERGRLRPAPVGAGADRGDSDPNERVLDELRQPKAPVDIELGSRPLPRSLQGADVPGGLGVDADGNLIVAPGVRVLFDHFLSAVGEEPLEVIRGRIIAEIRRRLPPKAQVQAIDLLDRYLEYRERARELYTAGASDNLDARLQQIRDLRRDVFGEKDAEGLFGAEEAVDYVAAAQVEIAKDKSIPEEERQRRIAALAQQLPEEVRQAREEVMKPQRFFAEQEQLRARGASPQEVRALRERYWGAEAADRLEQVDQEETEFQGRVDAFRAERAKIEANAALPPEERQRQIDELARARFSEPERLRLEALDRIEQEGEAGAEEVEAVEGEVE